MAHTFYVEFADGRHLDIQLTENNPMLEKWIEIHKKNKIETNNNFLSRRGMYFYHGNKSHLEDPKFIVERAKAVDEINKAIDEWDDLMEFKFPYRAHYNMDWNQTNIIHRAFTTCLSSKKTFKFASSRKELLDLKYRDDLHQWFREEVNDFGIGKEVAETGMIRGVHQSILFSILERINKWVHYYEDRSWNERAVAELQQADDPTYLEVEWDTYQEDGSKTYYVERLDRSFRDYCDYDPADIDVYMCKNITGKDYIQCYQEYDDPLEWDICNMDHVNGGFSVDKGNFLGNWLTKDTTKQWFTHYDMPFDKKIIMPPPLGKVRNKEWFDEWHTVKVDTENRNSYGNFTLNAPGRIVNTEIH